MRDDSSEPRKDYLLESSGIGLKILLIGVHR
jgi:hypothetical protein